MIENTKNLIVASKSRYASMVELETIKQQPEERAEAFLAKLKTKARQIGYTKTVQCAQAILLDYNGPWCEIPCIWS